ncbi:MAG: metal-sensitive transcriptional regulator [Vulcanimicrobiaceae bacterium]
MATKARSTPKAPGSLDLDEETTRQILARLGRVEGQVRAIARMIEQKRDCHAIAQQMGAAKSALERATVQLMASSLVHCIRPTGNHDFDQKEVARLTDTFVKILG